MPNFIALTLLEVRHLLLDTEMDDHWQGGVTAATVTGVTVPDLSGYPTDHFRGAFLYIYAGTGRGQERVLTGSFGEGVLSVAGWDIRPDTTSLIELHKKHSVARVNRAIKRASEDALMRQWVPMTDETLVVTDAEATHYLVPSGFVAIHDMYVRDSAGSLTHIRQSSMTYKEGWDILAGTREIVLPAQPLGFVLVLHGSALATSPVSDDSLVEIDPEFLIPSACSILLRGGAGGREVDPDSQLQKSLMYSQQAMTKLKRLGQRIPSGSRRL